jgi:ABC-type multidrug transport system fused ATPase/permease subunit
MDRADWSPFLIQAYILGIPLWWGLGFDFMIPQTLALALLCLTPSAHRHFTLPDYLLASIILTLGIAAYVNGFLLSQETMRFVGALYNLSLWVSGLIVLQQVRHILNRDDAHRRAILRSCFWAFMLMAAIAIGAFGLGYVVHRFSLVVPSVFGMTLGHHVPASAVIVEQSTTLVFTRPDWGLPGVPMPRVTVYGPYPTATAALAAVLGTLAILYLKSVKRVGALVVLIMEGLVLLTLAITLTRSILGGWVAGALATNLVFGTGYRRLAACGAIAAAMLLFVVQTNVAGVAEYRAYSSESRFKNYVRAFNETLLANPVLGLGFKPREEGNHIAVGSHSTFVSSFTKGGTLGASLVIAYLVFVPAFRWIGACGAAEPGDPSRGLRSERRLLLNLQVAIWVWLCFEDIDAPATAATLIFLAFAFIEAASRRERPRLSDSVRPAVLFAAHRAT